MKAVVNIIILSSLLISGCGNFNTAHRVLRVDNGEGALIDIKQRAIFVSKATSENGSTVRICAEPSPDSISSYAAELVGEAGSGDATAKLTSAFQESASFVGLRTQSIQLLRDSLYRMCEGYMSGALDKAKYDILMRRYQKFMVALLAIEQLTSTVRVPTVTLSTEGKAEASKSISIMRTEIKGIDEAVEKNDVDISALSTIISSKESLKKDAGTSEAQKTQLESEIELLKSKVTAIEKENKDLTGDKKSISAGINNAKGHLVSGSAKASVSSVGLPTQRGDAHVLAIAKTVKAIVMKILDIDDIGQLCWAHLSQGLSDSPLNTTCMNYLDSINNDIKIRQERFSAQTKAYLAYDMAYLGALPASPAKAEDNPATPNKETLQQFGTPLSPLFNEEDLGRSGGRLNNLIPRHNPQLIKDWNEDIMVDFKEVFDIPSNDVGQQLESRPAN